MDAAIEAMRAQDPTWGLLYLAGRCADAGLPDRGAALLAAIEPEHDDDEWWTALLIGYARVGRAGDVERVRPRAAEATASDHALVAAHLANDDEADARLAEVTGPRARSRLVKQLAEIAAGQGRRERALALARHPALDGWPSARVEALLRVAADRATLDAAAAAAASIAETPALREHLRARVAVAYAEAGHAEAAQRLAREVEAALRDEAYPHANPTDAIVAEALAKSGAREPAARILDDHARFHLTTRSQVKLALVASSHARAGFLDEARALVDEAAGLGPDRIDPEALPRAYLQLGAHAEAVGWSAHVPRAQPRARLLADLADGCARDGAPLTPALEAALAAVAASPVVVDQRAGDG